MPRGNKYYNGQVDSRPDPKKELSHADLHVMAVVIALAYGRSTSHTTTVATSCQLSGGQWRPIDGATGVAVVRCPSAGVCLSVQIKDEFNKWKRTRRFERTSSLSRHPSCRGSGAPSCGGKKWQRPHATGEAQPYHLPSLCRYYTVVVVLN